MLVPPPLRPGDPLAVVAPSSPFEPTLGWRGLGWLASRYRVRFSRGLFAVHGYLAGDRDRRADELARAICAPDVRAVVVMRGGYGLHQVAHRLDWSILAHHPKWIVGFSDVTVLHVEAAAVGVASLHAPMLASLGRGCERTRQQWIEALEHPEQTRTWADLATVRPGRGSGPLFGGNLTVLHACAVAGRLRVPPGAVLLLEDVGERPYRIDRMLTTLITGGHFAGVSGVVLGDFAQCDPDADGIRVEPVLRDILSELRVAVACGLPVGHSPRNDPIVLGSHAEIDAREDFANLTTTLAM